MPGSPLFDTMSSSPLLRVGVPLSVDEALEQAGGSARYQRRLLLSLGMEPSNRDLMKKAKVPDYITGICSYVGSTALDNAFAIQVM